MTDDAAARLADERSRVAVQVAELADELQTVIAASEGEALDDEHDPDGSTVGFERARVAALLDAARRRLAGLDEAAARVEAGAYGVCAVCGEPIGAERLAARPDATECVNCAGGGGAGAERLSAPRAGRPRTPGSRSGQ
ncbi:MAG TPA: TraR/DksA C4-type zinc finger protein [Acidimicrobiales bacterium]|nr:TraR/DksA C4-type zinc finger protein [Acidimicrobiales bacterium]